MEEGTYNVAGMDKGREVLGLPHRTIAESRPEYSLRGLCGSESTPPTCKEHSNERAAFVVSKVKGGNIDVFIYMMIGVGAGYSD